MLSVSEFYMVDFEIGRTRTVFRRIRIWGECSQHSVVDVRNLGQGEVLLRTAVSKGCGLRTVKAVIDVKRPRLAGRVN